MEQGEPATTRCNVARDAGYTRADKAAAEGKEAWFCIHFARGCCAKGSACEYYHRIPIPADLKNIKLDRDCFGRERFGEHRKDMGGSRRAEARRETQSGPSTTRVARCTWRD